MATDATGPIQHPERWVSVALDRIVATLGEAGPGSRNTALRAAGFRWGRIRHIAGDQAAACEAMLASAALNLGLTKREVEQTLSRAIRDGKAEPAPYRVERADYDAGPKLRIRHSAINPGDDDAPEPFDTDAPRKTTSDDARAIWAAAHDFLGTPAELYLRKRGLPPERIHCDVRHIARADRHACIFPVTANGEIVAIQRVSIDETGEPVIFEDGRKRKLTTGPAGDGAFIAMDGIGPEIVCEGPEDALSIAAAIMAAGRTDMRVSAALTAPTRLLKPGATLFADNDGTLPDMERAAAQAGALVAVPPAPFKDANDLWRAQGADGVVAALEAAEPPDVLHIETVSAVAARIASLPPKHEIWSTFRSREMCMVFGRSNAGKSVFLQDLMCSCVEPEKYAFLGGPVSLPDDRPVLWLSGEKDAEDWVARLGGWRNDRVRFADLRSIMNVAALPRWFEGAVADHCLVVVDTALTSIHYREGMASESVISPMLWNSVHANVKPLLHIHNTCMILSHHAPKGSDTGNTPYGDMAENSMDQIIQIKKAGGREVAEGGAYESATGIAEWYKVRGQMFPQKVYFRIDRMHDAARPGQEGRLRTIPVNKKEGDDV